MGRKNPRRYGVTKTTGLVLLSDTMNSLFLGKSIAKRLQGDKVAHDCEVTGVNGSKKDDLRRRTRQSSSGGIPVVGVCIGTNDIFSGCTLKMTIESVSELINDVALKFKPSQLLVCTLPPLERSVSHQNNKVKKFNVELENQLLTGSQTVTSMQLK